jgi:3-oxoadipate enol-lactonase / 4-carboxymuconolactone decarboxylase
MLDRRGENSLAFASVNGTRLYYRLEGRPDKPVIVLSHSIGTDHGLWAPQASDLLPHFQVLRFDTRGHGASEATSGEYSVELLARDTLALVDHLNIQTFAFCGLSLGGAIGQWLGAHAADRLTRVVLANTSPQFSPRSNWENRIKLVQQSGMAAIADVAMQRFFSAETLAHNEPCAGSIKSVLLGTNAVGYLGCCAALRDFDFVQSLGHIRVPALVISGDHDVSTPWQGHGEILAREIPGAQAVHLPTAHLSNLERPRSFSAALFGFLLPQSSGDTREAGNLVRRAVLGDSHVDRAQSATTDFDREFQDLITRYAWGSVWSRPDLDVRTRRLIVLVIMGALGRWEEFSMHVRAGLEHGLEPCDLKEALLQLAIYAGVPAANTGFRLAAELMEQPGKKVKLL